MPTTFQDDDESFLEEMTKQGDELESKRRETIPSVVSMHSNNNSNNSSSMGDCSLKRTHQKSSRAPTPLSLPPEETDSASMEDKNDPIESEQLLDRTREMMMRKNVIDDSRSSFAGLDMAAAAAAAESANTGLVLVRAPDPPKTNVVVPTDPTNFALTEEPGLSRTRRRDPTGPPSHRGSRSSGISYQGLTEVRGSQTNVSPAFANVATPVPTAPIHGSISVPPPTPLPSHPAPVVDSAGIPFRIQPTAGLHVLPNAPVSEQNALASAMPSVQDSSMRITHPTTDPTAMPQQQGLTAMAPQPTPMEPPLQQHQQHHHQQQQQQQQMQHVFLADGLPRSVLEQNTTTTTLQASGDNRLYHLLSSVQHEHQSVDSRFLALDRPTIIQQTNEAQSSQQQKHQFVNLPPPNNQPMPYAAMVRSPSNLSSQVPHAHLHLPQHAATSAMSTLSPSQMVPVPQPSSSFDMPHHQPPRRRSITLRLLQEITDAPTSRNRRAKKSFFNRTPRSQSDSHVPLDHREPSSLSESRPYNSVEDRGTIAVSWYEGTSTSELNGHVLRSVHRKLGIKEGGKNVKLEDLRIIDETVQPNEEIVLSPFIPNGSNFLLRFSIKETKRESSPPPTRSLYQYSQPPDSPSAAPSPHLSFNNLAALNDPHLRESLLSSILKGGGDISSFDTKRALALSEMASHSLPPVPDLREEGPAKLIRDVKEKQKLLPNRRPLTSVPKTTKSKEPKTEEEKEEEEPKSGKSIDEQLLLQLHELLLESMEKDERKTRSLLQQEERRQVVFVLIKYFLLFLGVIVVSAGIHERAPGWMEWVNRNVDSVQSCSADRDALFDCVSNGDFSGLVAAFIFWLTRSATTKQIFLFGFESPKKLWTVVYEAGVSALCWGTSYTFIRRGMNPDTRTNFLQKYWKDAVYGSLAGFNAAFMKAVLKNLIPQDQVLASLENRQLKIVDWMGQAFRSA